VRAIRTFIFFVSESPFRGVLIYLVISQTRNDPLIHHCHHYHLTSTNLGWGEERVQGTPRGNKGGQRDEIID
jgi:hypothetical protein